MQTIWRFLAASVLFMVSSFGVASAAEFKSQAFGINFVLPDPGSEWSQTTPNSDGTAVVFSLRNKERIHTWFAAVQADQLPDLSSAKDWVDRKVVESFKRSFIGGKPHTIVPTEHKVKLGNDVEATYLEWKLTITGFDTTSTGFLYWESTVAGKKIWNAMNIWNRGKQYVHFDPKSPLLLSFFSAFQPLPSDVARL